MNQTKDIAAVVCPHEGPKTSRERSATYRVNRLRHIAAEKGVQLHTHCRDCGRPIKPSLTRAFCRGGRCREAYNARVRVTRVEKIDATARRLAAEVSAYV